MKSLAFAVVVLHVLLLAGCLERKEKITIEPDGALSLVLEFSSKSFEDLYEGDALPSVEAGWLVHESVARDDQGEETFTLVAEAIFPPDADVPSSYARPGDPEGDLALRFPTTVEIEQRGDALYYHFARRYQARPWAPFAAAREMLAEHLEGLESNDPKELAAADRAALVRRILQAETLDNEVFARQAYRRAMPEVSQDVYLETRAALLGVARTLDVDRMADALLLDDEDRREEVLAAEQAAFQEEGAVAMQRTLRQRGISIGKVNAFLRAYDRQRRFHEITKDLGDDAFTIAVHMPGEIVAHNGDTLAGGAVTWRFGGELLRDRELELLVTSVVELD